MDNRPIGKVKEIGNANYNNHRYNQNEGGIIKKGTLGSRGVQETRLGSSSVQRCSVIA